MGVLFARMYVYHVCIWCLWRSEESLGSPGTAVTEDEEMLHGCCEPNPGPLREQVSVKH